MNKIIEKLDDFLEWGGVKKKIIYLVLSGVFLLFSILDVPMPFPPAWVAILLCGLPIILEACIGLVTAFDIKADVLVSLALIAALCIGENFAAGEVAFIMQLGELLEELTVAKARAGIEKLVHLTPQTARVVRDGKEEVIPAERVKVGDIIRVLPGESIPVDGEILSGQTSINQAVMTGESLPVDKTVGDHVSSGTVNQFGAFVMKATKVGEDSAIQRMIQLVQSADAGKAKIVGIADRWATWIVVIALSVAVITGLVTGEIIRAVAVLVVFCPCALVLATPTAIMAAIGNATKHGFLVRAGDALERLAQVSEVAFDKTGTLTHGTPVVTEIVALFEESQEEIYSYVASVETRSEHPLGKAIVLSYGKETKEVEDFQMIPGEGVMGRVDHKWIKAGNLKLLSREKEMTISDDTTAEIERYRREGCTVIYISVDEVFAGYLVLSDTVRADSKKMVGQLKKAGVMPVLLTGDNQNTAEKIATEIGITEVYANCLPEDKMNYIKESRKNHGGVCMMGDGVNDAPALKQADVGIAMGGIGSDIAVDAADIVLVADEVKELPHLIHLSKRMMTTIKYNLSFSMGLNFLAIALAVTGVLNPVVGALVHNAGSIAVILNSAWLLQWKGKREKSE